MFKRGMTICLVLAMATVAQAGAVITLTPDNPGPYFGGETVVVDVGVSQDTGADIFLRGEWFDFSASDSALSLDSFEFVWTAVAWCAPPFNICNGLQHEQFPLLGDADGALVSAVFSASAMNTDLQVPLPGDGSSAVLGQLTLTLPAATGSEMTYMLDALNAGVIDTANEGAAFSFGFGGAGDLITAWHVPNDVTGSMLGLTVIPEPATLALLALGGIATLRRRRSA